MGQEHGRKSGGAYLDDPAEHRVFAIQVRRSTKRDHELRRVHRLRPRSSQRKCSGVLVLELEVLGTEITTDCTLSTRAIAASKVAGLDNYIRHDFMDAAPFEAQLLGRKSALATEEGSAMRSRRLRHKCKCIVKIAHGCQHRYAARQIPERSRATHPFLAGTQASEILRGLGNCAGKQLDFQSTRRNTIDADLHEDKNVRLCPIVQRGWPNQIMGVLDPLHDSRLGPEILRDEVND